MSSFWTRRAHALTLVGPGSRFRRLIGWRILLIAAAAIATALIVGIYVERAIRTIDDAATISVVWSVYWAAVAFASTTIILAFRNLFLRSENIRARRRTRYIFDETLGEGGAGVVFKAHAELLKRPVAIKILHPEKLSRQRVTDFEREATVLCRLTHPNTVEVYDHGRTPKNLLYCVMEYIEGVTLADLVMVEDAVVQERVVHILQQVCGSLAEAHHHRLIHRDIKPENVMLTVRGGVHDFVKVLDFGLVKEIELGSPSDPAAVRAPGTPPYVAPERVLDGLLATPASDLYSLGGVAYFLLTGRPVFRGATDEILRQTLNEDPRPPSEVTNLTISPQFERVVMRLLSRGPDERHKSARELLEDLDDLDDLGRWTADDARRWWLDNKGQIDRSRETLLEDLGRAAR